MVQKPELDHPALQAAATAWVRSATSRRIRSDGARPSGAFFRPRFLLAFLRAGEENRMACEDRTLSAYAER